VATAVDPSMSCRAAAMRVPRTRTMKSSGSAEDDAVVEGVEEIASR
jgi:hypothetical protein